MTAKRKTPAVAQKRDPSWWLHPAYRGQQALPLDSAAGSIPHRWVHSDAAPECAEAIIEADSPHAKLAQVLYRLNGCRPGRVRGFYVIVAVDTQRYAVGQLCADPALPVMLFEDLIFASEGEARAKANSLRAIALGGPR